MENLSVVWKVSKGSHSDIYHTSTPREAKKAFIDEHYPYAEDARYFQLFNQLKVKNITEENIL